MSFVPRLPWTLRLLNRAGGLAGWRPAMDPEHIWATAAQAAGYEAPWPEAREALGTLLHHAEMAPLSALGRLALARELPRHVEQLLRVRLEVPDPTEPVLPPVFIVALPRTGTTLLHRLLSLHAHARWPRMWEVQEPWPPPGPAPDEARIARSEARARLANYVMPGFPQVHTLEPHGPEECYFLLAHTTCTAAYDSQLPIPGYTRWFCEQDLRWTYQHHQRSLLLLQRQQPGAFWLLKTPLHLFALDVIREIYPNARLVITHREPREVAASCCSLYAFARSIYVDQVVPESLGAPWLETWGEATDRAYRALQAWPADRVAHVDYRELLREPAAVTERVARQIGLPEDPELAERVRRWSSDPEHSKDRHGTHRYALQDYGLREGEVDERFALWRQLGADHS